MNNRSIGIDIGPDHLCAVQVSRTDGGFFVEKTLAAKMRRAVDSPSHILTELFTMHGFDSRAETAVSIPGRALLLNNIETDAATIEQSSTDDAIPNAERFITKIHIPAHQTGSKIHALLISVDRERLHERLNTILQADIRPVLAETALFAVSAAVTANYPQSDEGISLIVHIDKAYLTITITRDGSVVFARKIPVCDDNNLTAAVDSEIRLTYKKFFDSDIPPDTKVYLVTQLDNLKAVETGLANALHCRMTVVDPFAGMQHDPNCDVNTAVTVAEGLALRALIPDDAAGLNFLDALKNEKQQRFEAKKEIKTIIKLSAAIILVAIASLFVRLWKLEHQNGKIEKQTVEIFQQTLPDEKNIVNPLVQLEQKIASLQTGCTSFDGTDDMNAGPLEIIQQLTQTAPEQADITVGSLLMSDDSVRITGIAATFAPVYQWQQQLQQVPRFASVDVKDIQRLAAEKSVSFTIVIAMAKEKTQ